MSLTPAFDPLRQVTLFYESAETHDDDKTRRKKTNVRNYVESTDSRVSISFR
jgi:hypothetical protein